MERRTQHRRLQRSEQLTTALLLKICVWAMSIVIVASALTFVLTYQNARDRIITALQRDLQPTLERNQRVFDRIEGVADILSETFLNRYQLFRQNSAVYVSQFDDWYEETSPGVLRLKPEFYNGYAAEHDYFKHLSSFVGPRSEPVTDELKVRLIAAQYVLNDLGPAWQDLVANSHFSLPENALILHSQDQPWGLLADKDLVMTDFSVVKSTLQSENPAREPNWTGLYYDISAGIWTITYQQPIDLNGQHLVNSSFDVDLARLLNDLTRKRRSNAEHMVLNQKGDLIAASNLSGEAMGNNATLTPATYDEPIYQAVQRIIATIDASETPLVLEKEMNGQLLIIHSLAGPHWRHVTLYPLSEIRREALQLPLSLIAAGFCLVLLVLAIVYVLVKRHVTAPLQTMAKVASMLGSKNYQDALNDSPEQRSTKGEVKQAVDAFKTMASRFISAQQSLEHDIAERTNDLAEANRQLDALAHLDGLTGLFNRRAFDKDLLNASGTEAHKYYLVLIDIDHFKAYNDNYGHEAGDQALKRIARYLTKEVTGRVYRYGGEELAIILNQKSRNDVRTLIDGLRAGIEALKIEHQYQEPDHQVLTVSIGAAQIIPGSLPETSIRAADQELYQAKREGRNRVCVL